MNNGARERRESSSVSQWGLRCTRLSFMYASADVCIPDGAGEKEEDTTGCLCTVESASCGSDRAYDVVGAERVRDYYTLDEGIESASLDVAML